MPVAAVGTWEQTVLWQTLESRADKEIKTALAGWMPKIEETLAKANTAPSTYTLHDNEHSFRVAEWMTQIVPATDPAVLPQLSSYELAFLLMSAYLHDIGMTPREAKIRAVKSFLLGSTDRSDDPDISSFLDWIAAERNDISLPLDPNLESDARQGLIEELTAQYVRSKHNAWSAELMRAWFADEQLGTFQGWLDALITLCQSHHYGYDRLKSEAFKPQRVGSPAATVHLRYLAAVLRVADILDVDPRRTPENIQHYRIIDASSEIYWEKDRPLTLEIRDNRVIATAAPRTARIHQAISNTLDQISIELALCRRLDEETFFGMAAFGKLPHRWELHSSLFRDITPAPGTYVWINGNFRPDGRRILELLSSAEFHPDPVTAVGALICNAFDAVREETAYERLAYGEPRPHKVMLQFQQEKEENWLVCTDDGAGMTRDIIENHFLVSGSARPDIQRLARQCQARNFRLGRSGQFGISVLSYFAIADHLELETQRSPDALAAASEDSVGPQTREAWRFETNGIGTVGELRPFPLARVGTKVRIRLRPNGANRDFSDLRDRISLFLKESVQEPPCDFVFDPGGGEEQLRFIAGAPAQVDVARLFHKVLKQRPAPAPVRVGPREATDAEQQRQLLAADIGVKLRWREETGDLPDSLGRYRIRLPYFELPGGPCLGFLQAVQESGDLVILPATASTVANSASGGTGNLLPNPPGLVGWNLALIPEAELTTTWNGMKVCAVPPPTTDPKGFRAIVAIDWQSSAAGRTSMRGNSLQLTEAASASGAWVARRVATFIASFLNDHRDSVYATLNAHIAGQQLPAGSKTHWISPATPRDPENGECADASTVRRTWREIPFPAAVGMRSGSRWRWLDRPVSELPSIGVFSWSAEIINPDRIVAVPGDGQDRPGYATALWTGGPRRTACALGAAAAFPPAWQHLVKAETIWNRDHPLVQAVSAPDKEWLRQHWEVRRDPISHQSEILASPGKAAAWLAESLYQFSSPAWKAIIDQHKSFLGDVWNLVLGSPEPVAHWAGSLLTLSPSDANVIDYYEDPLKQLGDPGEEWRLTLN